MDNTRTSMKHRPAVFSSMDKHGNEHKFFIKRVKCWKLGKNRYIVIDEHKNRVSVVVDKPISEQAEYSYQHLSKITTDASVEICNTLRKEINKLHVDIQDIINNNDKEYLWTKYVEANKSKTKEKTK